MTYNWKAIIGAAITGFLVAARLDYHAYMQAPPGTPFDFKKAVPRWLEGAFLGALAAIGISG